MKMKILAIVAVILVVTAFPAYVFAGEVNVRVEVGDHGSVNGHSESYTESVVEGAAYQISIRAEEGYEIQTVKVNDESVAGILADPIEGQTSAEITLGQINGDADIAVTFRAKASGADTGSTDDTGTESTDQAETETEATDQAGSETEATDQAEAETEATDQAETETEATDQAGSETETTDPAGSETGATEQAGSETEATEQAGSETEAADPTGPGTDLKAKKAESATEAKTKETAADELIITDKGDVVPASKGTSPKTGDATQIRGAFIALMFCAVMMVLTLSTLRRRS